MNEGVPKKNNIFFLELFFFMNLNGMTHETYTITYIVRRESHGAQKSEEGKVVLSSPDSQTVKGARL